MNNDTIFDVSERKKRLAKTALNEVLKELKKEGILVGYDNVEGCLYVVDEVLVADKTHYDTEASGEYVLRNRIDVDKDLTRFFGTNAAEGFGPVFKGDRDIDESRSRHGRMLKEEDERVSLDVSVSDEWSEDGKKYVELEVKKNGKNTPVNVCVVFTDKGEHLDTIFYNTEKNNEDLTENEVAEELDVSVGDIKKLVEKAKIKAMKEFE